MDALETLFAPGGGLSRAHPAFEHRPGQERMSRAVADVLEDGGVLLVEAGTGTGKTLAYLLPAILSGRRVVISTGTRNLQDQIERHDLPFARERLGLEFTACVMKGRENYLCRYRLGQFVREPLLQDPAEKDWIPRLAAWSGATATGDRAEIPDLPEALRLWRDVNARADTCGGSRCPEHDACWLTRLKRVAAQSRIVVVNHHLFFADLALRWGAFGAVIPDYDAVVFDEAHALEEVATQYFGTQVSAGQIEELARETELVAVRAGAPGPKGAAAVLRAAGREFFGTLRAALSGAAGRQSFARPERGGPDVEAEWAALSTVLDDVVTAVQAADPHAGEPVASRSQALRSDLARVLARDEPGFVYGMELRGRANVVLSAAPIDVADALRARLFEPLHATVLTSATLAVEGSFEFFGRRLGVADGRTMIVESGFDHARQAVLYVPRGMPEPKSPRFLDRAVREIVELLEVTGGRAFLLFTSFANLEHVHQALARLARWPLFKQGEGSKIALVEAFRSTPGAVLCGTSSFWHGVDVPGAALSLVVVDKLPFDVPTDPLLAARAERIREAGGNPFAEYQTPLAVLQLKQGLGRLLRARTDRGVLAVLDPRIRTRPYGRRFLDSLPPYSRADDLEACARFFAAAEGEPCTSA